MARLIDADSLLEQYNLKDATKYGNKDSEKQAHSYSTMMLYEIADMIDDAPTAYDIDKVVEELEETKETSLELVKLHKFLKKDLQELVNMCFDEAIEIVNQGGVYDDVCEWKLEDEEANLYLTECQQRQLIFDGTPKENGYIYCPYCGKKINMEDIPSESVVLPKDVYFAGYNKAL